jgi:hypothetical protein
MLLGSTHDIPRYPAGGDEARGGQEPQKEVKKRLLLLQCDDPIRVICVCATSGLRHVEISIPIFFWSSSPTFTLRPTKI